MTFFDKADRFKENVALDSGLSPGEYIAHENYKIPESYAPFGSTAERDQPAKSKDVPSSEPERQERSERSRVLPRGAP